MDTIHAKTLLSKLREDPKPETCESVQEILWQCYTECHPSEDAQTREKLLALEPYFQELSPEAGDVFIDLLLDLSIAYQRAAFLDGFRYGFRLHDELEYKASPQG